MDWVGLTQVGTSLLSLGLHPAGKWSMTRMALASSRCKHWASLQRLAGLHLRSQSWWEEESAAILVHTSSPIPGFITKTISLPFLFLIYIILLNAKFNNDWNHDLGEKPDHTELVPLRPH